jgi:hypothetical protein
VANKRVYEIDGAEFSSLEDFYDQISGKLSRIRAGAATSMRSTIFSITYSFNVTETVQYAGSSPGLIDGLMQNQRHDPDSTANRKPDAVSTGVV